MARQQIYALSYPGHGQVAKINNNIFQAMARQLRYTLAYFRSLPGSQYMHWHFPGHGQAAKINTSIFQAMARQPIYTQAYFRLDQAANIHTDIFKAMARQPK